MGKLWVILGHSWRQLLGIVGVVGTIVTIGSSSDARAFVLETWAWLIGVVSLPIVFGPALLLASAGIGYASGRVFERRRQNSTERLHEQLVQIASKAEALCYRVKLANETDTANQSHIRAIRAFFVDLKSLNFPFPQLDASEVRTIYPQNQDRREAEIFCLYAFEYIDHVKNYLSPIRLEAGRIEATQTAKSVDAKLQAAIMDLRSAARSPMSARESADRARRGLPPR